jgi:hypothetical protein
MSEQANVDSHDHIEQIDERIDDLERAAADLRELGEAASNPAVERTATRVEGVVAAVRRQVPPEVVAEEAEGRKRTK